jgi:hypothetical protein
LRKKGERDEEKISFCFYGFAIKRFRTILLDLSELSRLMNVFNLTIKRLVFLSNLDHRHKRKKWVIRHYDNVIILIIEFISDQPRQYLKKLAYAFVAFNHQNIASDKTIFSVVCDKGFKL